MKATMYYYKFTFVLVNFFDGFRTSHNYYKISLFDQKNVRPFVISLRKNISSASTTMLCRLSVLLTVVLQKSKTFFTHREASNLFYDSLPEVVDKNLGEISKITDCEYHLFSYYKAEDVDRMNYPGGFC
jgi:pyruvate-ferredoxin/flavodoxin oxidoreductase